MYFTCNRVCNFMHRIAVSPTALSKMYLSDICFVPKCDIAKEEDVVKLRNFMKSHNSISVLTGAGISTESGIPDYRSAEVGLYARSNRRPVSYKEFCQNEAIRRRYWARNYVGWPRFSTVKPNTTHDLLKSLEDAGKIRCIITQNVDNLHIKAGSRRVIELHGTAFRVMCLNCDHKMCRYELQDLFSTLNPEMNVTSTMIRPDGDVDLSQEQVEEFKVPPCENCGGILKPDIVFFGDNVPRQTVDAVKYNIDCSDAVLILGTTLSTYSGYRITLQAKESNVPMAIVNIGKTRADDLVDIKVHGKCGDVLPRVCIHDQLQESSKY